MNIVQALILSFIEGVTEFLPISSTAHQVLVSNILNISQTSFVKSFEIIIQLGAILAVAVLYWKKFLLDKELIKKLFVALIPALGVGFVFYKFIKDVLLGNLAISLITLFVGGVILILVELYFKKEKRQKFELDKLNYKNSFVIGIFQSISVIPGVSRAAATIVGGMLTGLSRESATEFSFLLAVPTMFAATALDIYKSRDVLLGSNLTLLFVGFVGSFIFAILSIRFLINYVKTHNFIPFGVYRIVFSILYWVLILK